MTFTPEMAGTLAKHLGMKWHEYNGATGSPDYPLMACSCGTEFRYESDLLCHAESLNPSLLDPGPTELAEMMEAAFKKGITDIIIRLYSDQEEWKHLCEILTTGFTYNGVNSNGATPALALRNALWEYKKALDT